MAQLADITEGLAVYSAAAADRLGDELIAASYRLADFPQLGRALPEANFAELRELLVKKYRLVYTAGDFQIEIIAVLHQAQRR
ncbi:MAG TPA: type II toxin-antitoxin system RelE/ParE family toxin [Hymenobacter sp.]